MTVSPHDSVPSRQITSPPIAPPPVRHAPMGATHTGAPTRSVHPSPVAQRRAEALARLAARRMQLPPREHGGPLAAGISSPLRLVPEARAADPRSMLTPAQPNLPAATPQAEAGRRLPQHPVGPMYSAEPATRPAPDHRGESVTSDIAGLPDALPRPGLSHREQQVLRTWLLTDSKAEVADTLSISMGTVNTHLARIRTKYAAVGRRAGTKASLAARAIQDGLISLDEL